MSWGRPARVDVFVSICHIPMQQCTHTPRASSSASASGSRRRMAIFYEVHGPIGPDTANKLVPISCVPTSMGRPHAFLRLGLARMLGNTCSAHVLKYFDPVQ